MPDPEPSAEPGEIDTTAIGEEVPTPLFLVAVAIGAFLVLCLLVPHDRRKSCNTRLGVCFFTPYPPQGQCSRRHEKRSCWRVAFLVAIISYMRCLDFVACPLARHCIYDRLDSVIRIHAQVALHISRTRSPDMSWCHGALFG